MAMPMMTGPGGTSISVVVVECIGALDSSEVANESGENTLLESEIQPSKSPVSSSVSEVLAITGGLMSGSSLRANFHTRWRFISGGDEACIVELR
ncbi:hypothetical protein BM221_005961 [Beauveria bassiana]|uniref:Uncharacterized protein n=1 Tax=Beauveria bassiana TaxID=176275 RepID=A0A2N6NKJ1_BEABA|nr:hypothetical protein BM221_005961 [Beauveria bassiana]